MDLLYGADGLFVDLFQAERQAHAAEKAEGERECDIPHEIRFGREFRRPGGIHDPDITRFQAGSDAQFLLLLQKIFVEFPVRFELMLQYFRLDRMGVQVVRHLFLLFERRAKHPFAFRGTVVLVG